MPPEVRGAKSKAATTGARSSSGAWWGAALLILLLIGGTSERFFFGRGLAEAIGALLLGAAIANGGTALARDRLLAGMLWGLAALLALQAVPLPPAIWSALPGREIVAALDRALEVKRWRPVTLDWEALLPAVLFLVPCAGAMLAASSDDPRRRDWLLGAVGAAWAVAVVISVLQAIGGVDLRYNQTAHEVFVTGFFFNHNHHAAFLVCAGVLISAHLVERGLPKFAAAGVAFATGIAVLLTASRSGLVLFLLAGAVALIVARRRRGALARPGITKGLIAITLLLGAGLALLLAFSDGPLAALAGRDALLEDRRFTIWARSLDLLAVYWPVGAGLGTFPQVYALYEPLEEVRPLFVNHAHNDLLEFAIEAGLAGMLLLAFFFGWLIWRSLAALHLGTGASPTLCAALIVLWTLLAASVVEFPLRTVSMSALASLCLGLVAREGLSWETPLAPAAE